MPSVLGTVQSISGDITCRSDYLRWPSHYIRFAKTDRRAYDRMSRRLMTLHMSTAFSGVCTPSVALHALALANRFDGNETNSDIDLSNLNYAFAIDQDSDCRAELRTLPVPPICVHGDFDSFLAPGVLAECEALGAGAGLHDLCAIL